MRVAIVSGPDPGHLLPVTAIAEAFADRGHGVTVVTSARWGADLAAAGLDHVALPGSARSPGGADFGWRMWERAAEMAPSIAELLRGLSADVVVADTLATGGWFAADLLDLPWVEVTPHWLWEPSIALPPAGLGQRPARTPIGRTIERYQRRQQMRSVREGAAQRDAARARIGLRPSDRTAVLRLVGTVPALEPARPDWPPHTFVVGALEWDPPSWPTLAPPDGDAPLVLVTDSTAATSEAGLAERTVRGLYREPVRVVATTGASVPGREGITIGRGRHGPLLDHAACAVGPGGGGFVAKALSRGVPLILVPDQGDQRETAARVERLGAGVWIDEGDATPERLRATIREVLRDPSYRVAAAGVARTNRGLGASRATDLIELRVPGAGRSG